jgi:hypothetical protein
MASFWDQGPPQDFNLGTFKPAPPMPALPPAAQMGPSGPTYTDGQGRSTDQFGTPTTIPQQPGSDFGMKSPDKAFPFALPADATGGMTSGTIGNGGGTQGPINYGMLGSIAGGLGRMMQGRSLTPPQQSAFGNTLGSTMFSGMVPMQSPDGQFQYVNSDHVPHYQSRGATIYNGSSYGSGNG